MFRVGETLREKYADMLRMRAGSVSRYAVWNERGKIQLTGGLSSKLSEKDSFRARLPEGLGCRALRPF